MNGMVQKRSQKGGLAAPRPSGPSQRQLRVGEAIRHALADVLMRGELHDPALERLSLTVGEVRLSPDLRIATVFVLPLGGKGGEEAIGLLNRHKGEIRHLVMRGMTLRHAPELRFRLDDMFDRLDETRRMFADERVRRDVEGAPDDAPDGAPDGAPADGSEDRGDAPRG